MQPIRSAPALALLFALGGLGAPALAQDVLPSVTVAAQPAPDTSVAPPPAADQQPQTAAALSTGTPAIQNFTPDQLEQLVGAIALYPDALIAQILPASTYPIDIVRAARYVKSGGTDIDSQDWDPSVKAIAHNPAVLDLLNDNLEWMQQLGQAFTTQQAELMDAVQRRRLQAQKLGNLPSNDQQQVAVEDAAIRIFPTNPEIVYIPVYDPAVVYYQPAPLYSSWVSYGWAYPCGWWFNLDCDWSNRWCYSPGWSWNTWYSHYNCYAADAHHSRRWCSPSHDFHARAGHSDNVWRRNSAHPYSFAHHPTMSGDSFRRAGGFSRDGSTGGRGYTPSGSFHQGGAPTPGRSFRGSGSSAPTGTPSRSSTHFGSPASGDHTSRSLTRPLSSGTSSSFSGRAGSSGISSHGMPAINARSGSSSRYGSFSRSSSGYSPSSTYRSTGSYGRAYQHSAGSYGSSPSRSTYSRPSSTYRSYSPGSYHSGGFRSGSFSHGGTRSFSAPSTTQQFSGGGSRGGGGGGGSRGGGGGHHR